MSTFYVATTGSDSAAGSSDAPWRTLSKAVGTAKGGDEIVVRDGTYNDTVIEKAYPGWLVIRAENKHGAQFQPTIYSAIAVRNASFVELRGLRVRGNPARPQADGHGVDIEASHHIRVIGCLLHDNGGSGAVANHSDHVLFEGNEVYGNCGENRYQTSALNMYVARDLGGASDDFRMVIRNNVIHHNGQTYAGAHSDGNGIILDWFKEENYPGRTLIENNLVYANGGRGIHLFHTSGATLRRNTVVGNSQDAQLDGVWRGELSNTVSNGNAWDGNIGVCDRSNSWNRAINWTEINGEGGAGVTFSRNMTWNGTPGDASVLSDFGPLVGTGNLLGVDPQLVDFVPTNPAAAEMGWRPSGIVPTPIPEPEPVPEPPDQLSPFALLKPAEVVTEGQAYELGTKIVAGKPGKITALRLYRTNSNAQTVRLWKGTQRIAAGTIPGGTGWAELAVDVPAVAGDAFIVSVGKSVAQKYAADTGALASAVQGDGFTIPANGGVFATTVGQFPTQVWNASYYWVDVRFSETTPEPEPDPDMEARLAALEAQVAAMAAEYGPRILLLEAQMAAAVADLTDAEAETARLDARLDAISGAAGD